MKALFFQFYDLYIYPRTVRREADAGTAWYFFFLMFHFHLLTVYDDELT